MVTDNSAAKTVSCLACGPWNISASDPHFIALKPQTLFSPSFCSKLLILAHFQPVLSFSYLEYLKTLLAISPAVVGDMNAAAVLVMVAGYVEMSRVSN